MQMGRVAANSPAVPAHAQNDLQKHNTFWTEQTVGVETAVEKINLKN
jgi:hypothetical protein